MTTVEKKRSEQIENLSIRPKVPNLISASLSFCVFLFFVCVIYAPFSSLTQKAIGKIWEC